MRKKKQSQEANSTIPPVFDGVPDFVVANEILPLLPMMSVVNFGRTNRRFNKLVKSSPHLWSTFDAGQMWESAASRVGTRKAILQVLRSPYLPLCGRFSETSNGRPREIPFSHAIAIMSAIPNLKEASLRQTDGAEVARADLKKIVPEKVRVLMSGRMTFDVVRDFVEKLETLETLRVETTSETFIRVPPAVVKLEVSPILLNFMPGPYTSVKELALETHGKLSAVEMSNFPELTALSIEHHEYPWSWSWMMEVINGTMQAVFKNIMTSCCKLKNLRVSFNDVLSIEQLEVAPCATQLTRLCIGTVSAGALSVIGRSCPNLTELFVTELSEASGTSVMALAALKRLEVLSMRFVHKSSGDNGTAAAFTVLGASEGAAPFKQLDLVNFCCDPTPFFLSPRCHFLCDVIFEECDFPESAIRALAENSADTLVSAKFIGGCFSHAPQLLAGARSLERFALNGSVEFISERLLREIGEKSIAPLKELSLNSSRSFVGAGLEQLAPAVKTLEKLTIPNWDLSAAKLMALVHLCPCLRELRVCSPTSCKVQAQLSRHVKLESVLV